MSRQSRMGFVFGLGVVAMSAYALLTWMEMSSAQGSEPALQITSPSDGTIVAPGDTITVVVSPAPDTTFAQIIIIGEDPLGFSDAKAAPPFEFSLTIPIDISPSNYRITARGFITPGSGIRSSPIILFVEKPQPLVQLRVEPSLIDFELPGQQIPLRVIGTFSDDTTFTITESMQTIFSSNDGSVATVDSTGLVTAAGAGNAEITVIFGAKAITIPVSVPERKKD